MKSRNTMIICQKKWVFLKIFLWNVSKSSISLCSSSSMTFKSWGSYSWRTFYLLDIKDRRSEYVPFHERIVELACEMYVSLIMIRSFSWNWIAKVDIHLKYTGDHCNDFQFERNRSFFSQIFHEECVIMENLILAIRFEKHFCKGHEICYESF